MRMLIVGTALIFGLSCGASFAQPDASKYPPAKLDSITAAFRLEHATMYDSLEPTPDSANYMFIDGAINKFQASVLYADSTRPISENAKMVCEGWWQGARREGLKGIEYRTEILVTQEGTQYWIPIQEVLMAPLREELTGGGYMTIYVMIFGITEKRVIMSINGYVAEEY